MLFSGVLVSFKRLRCRIPPLRGIGRFRSEAIGTAIALGSSRFCFPTGWNSFSAKAIAVRIMTAFDLNWEIAKSLSNKRSEKTLPETASRSLLGKLPTHYVLLSFYLAIIATVATYDIYLTVQYQKTLYEMELNPIGRWIMGLDDLQIPGVYPVKPPNVMPFVLLKSAGTMIVLGTILILVHRWSRIGHGVGVGVSTFQLGLAAFLTFA